MTKAAVAGLTRGLTRGPARDLGPRGITVYNVQPGLVETDISPAEGPFADPNGIRHDLGTHRRNEMTLTTERH